MKNYINQTVSNPDVSKESVNKIGKVIDQYPLTPIPDGEIIPYGFQIQFRDYTENWTLKRLIPNLN